VALEEGAEGGGGADGFAFEEERCLVALAIVVWRK